MIEEGRLVRDIFGSIFLGSPREPVWKWADENVYLTETQSAELPRYDSSETPWTRDIQDSVRDPRTQEVAVMKSSQTGITEGALNVIRYMPSHYPGNCLYLINSENKARDVFRSRIIPSVEALAKNQLTGDPDDVSSLTIRLKNMIIKGSGSGTSSPFRETWYRVVILDEPEDHQPSDDGNSYDLVKSRFATVSNYTLYVIGKPQNEGGIIHDCYLRGSQEKYMVACPRCSGRIELKFDQLRYRHCMDHFGEWDLDAVESDTWYQCQLCDGRIDEGEKYSMVATGEWQPATKKERMRLRAKPVAREPGVRSFHISDLYSPFPQVTWGKLAKKWVAAAFINVSESKKDDFRKNHLGLPIEPRELRIVDETIEALRGGITETTYYEVMEEGRIVSRSRTEKLGERFSLCYDANGRMIADLPVDPIFLTISVDKQHDCLKYTVMAWQRDGQSWLIDFGRLANEVELLRVMPARPYRYRDAERGIDRTHRIYGGVFDRGYRPKDVYRACRAAQRKGWHLYPCLGGGVGDQYTSKSLTEKTDVLASGATIRYYYFHDHSVKMDFYFGTIQDRSNPRLWMPDPVPADIIVELTSEHWDSTKNRFVHPPGSPPNDFGDCLKMQKGVVWPLLSGFLAQPK